MPSLFFSSRPLVAAAMGNAHVVVFPGLFAILAGVLAAAYWLVPSYASAVVVLTGVVMVITWPLSHRAMRAQAAMAKLQPRLVELRRKHKDDPRRLSAETRALFKEHHASPAAGCLPAMLQLPLFIAMYQVIRGLAHRPALGATFRPRYLPHASRLYKALAASHTMHSWGIDLAQTGIVALHATALSAVVFCVLIAITIAAGLAQQHMVTKLTRPATRPKSDTPAHMELAGPFAQILFGCWALVLPVGVGLYYATSSVIRLAQQATFIRIHPLT